MWDTSAAVREQPLLVCLGCAVAVAGGSAPFFSIDNPGELGTKSNGIVPPRSLQDHRGWCHCGGAAESTAAPLALVPMNGIDL
jgi:hypothetical protein